MNAVAECLKAVRLGTPQAHLNLTVVPLLGGALAVDGKVVHLCAFRLSRGATTDARNPQSRLVRASVRRRRVH